MDSKGSYMDHLNEMPNFQAPAALWDRLETSMFSVNTGALPVMSPSNAVWSSLEKKLVLRKRVYRAGIVGFLIILLTFSGFYIYNSSSTSDSLSVNSIENYDQNKNEIVIPSTSASVSAGSVEGRSDNNAATVLPSEAELQSVELGDVGDVEDLEDVGDVGDLEDTEELRLESLEMRDGIVLSSCIKEIDHRDRYDECSSFYGSTSEFYWGASYEYQFFMEGNTYLDTEQKYWQSAGINGKLCFGKFYLESGLGVTFARDKTPWSYDYTKYELINTYEYVDSVHYDPATGETTYYTSYVDVYDSVEYSETTSVKKNYTYLKIPLFVGVRLFERQNFSSSLSGGIIYNILIGTKTTETVYDEPDSRITAVYFNETTRLQNNFSLGLHLNFEWQLNDNMNFYFYPSFKYYLNPLYDGDTEAQPMSVGVGIGLWFK